MVFLFHKRLPSPSLFHQLKIKRSGQCLSVVVRITVISIEVLLPSLLSHLEACVYDHTWQSVWLENMGAPLFWKLDKGSLPIWVLMALSRIKNAPVCETLGWTNGHPAIISNMTWKTFEFKCFSCLLISCKWELSEQNITILSNKVQCFKKGEMRRNHEKPL